MKLLMNVIRILFFVFFCCATIVARGDQGEAVTNSEIKRVLFVSSYHSEQVWGRKVLNAINKQLKKTLYNMDLRVIYLDSKRLTDSEVRRSLLETHLREINGKLDLIIVADEEANEALFSLDMPWVKETPIVFCGVMQYDKHPGFDHVTGVIYDIDYEKVFLLGRKLFPGAERVYVFSDNTGVGQAHKLLAQKQLAKYEEQFPVFFEGDSTMDVEHFIDTLKNLYPASFVILTTWQQGKQGIYLDPDIYYSMFTSECLVPVFTAMDSGLGKGIFGGIIAFANQQGVQAGQLAVRILNGEKAEAIPVDTVRSVPVFDEVLLKRWRVDLSLIPENSIILNKHSSFWVLYKGYILTAGAVFVVLLILVSFLVMYQLRYRKMLRRSIYLEKSAHQLAEVLVEKTEMLSNTLSSMNEGIIVVNKDLHIVELNNASSLMLGCNPGAIGKLLGEVCEFSCKMCVHGMEGFVKKVMQEKEKGMLPPDAVLIPRDGLVQQVSGSVSPLLDSSGVVKGAVIMFRNITKEWQQQRFLKISMGALRAYSWFYDVEKDFLEFGEGFAESGVLKEEFNNLEKFVAHIHPDDQEKFQRFFRKFLRDGSSEFSMMFRVDYLHTGKYQWWECRGVVETVEMNDGQRVKYLYGMGIDISTHKQAEENMAAAMRRAEESDRLKTAFLANISHEIRTPLNGIVGFANLICESGYLDEEKLMFRDAITNNSRALLDLLDDVLELSSIESGTESVHTGVCDLHFLVHSVLDIGHLNVEKGVELIVKGPDHELLVLTDESKLTKVFLRLINNAKKFTAKGHIVVEAKVTDDGKWIECSVADSGIGILPENIDRLFERFYKVNEFKQGTGLGLPICKAIVELLGGTIWIESHLGEGTTVYFRVPYRGVENVI